MGAVLKGSFAGIKIQPGLRTVALLLMLLWLSACSSSHPLAPTPNVFTGQGGYPAQGIAPQFRTSEPELIYVTDRKVRPDSKGPPVQ